MKRYFIILITSIVMIVLSVAGLWIFKSIPVQVKQETAQVNYSQTGNYSYLIYLKPSYLYGPAPQISLPNPQYPMAAVGTIDFTYSFSPVTKGTESAYVDAVLENPGIWQKTINLVPQTSKTDDFSLSFSLYPNQMNSLFDAIEKETGITASPRSLTVNVHINLGADSLVQSLPITLDKTLIEISSNLNQTLPEGKGKFNYTLNRKKQSLVGIYPAEIVKSLDFTFNYQPVTPKSATVSVEAVLENPGIWQKRITLVPEASISGNLQEQFTLSLDDIQNQFNDIDQQTKLTTSPRLVTIKASVVRGNDSFVQSLPITIDKGVIEIPGDLQLVQPNGTGIFDYVVNLKPNSLFSSSTLHPPQPTPTPTGQMASNYDINLKPDPAPADSSEISLNPGQTAFTNLVDKMVVTLDYQFQADQQVNALSTNVDISAIIEAPNVWSKTFTLLHASKSGSFNLSFPIDMAGYIAMLQAIKAETGVSPDSYNISIVANLHTTGETNFGKIDETFSPSMKGTITGNVLQWNKDLTTNLPGSIKTTKTTPNPQKYIGLSARGVVNLIWVVAVIFLVLFGLSLALFIKTKPVSLPQLEKESLQIKKKYGKRMVEALNHAPPDGETTISLGAMEDLIKVADELAKPIIYQEPVSNGELHAYFILDGTTRYQYLLNLDSRNGKQ